MKVLSIGYGRHLFCATDKERQRMEACAATTAGYHMVVFTRRHDALTATTGENGLHLYPTSAWLRPLQPLAALVVGWRVIHKGRSAAWVITTQDSFVAGLVGLILAWWFQLPLNVQEHGGEFNGPYWRERSLSNRLLYQLGRFVLTQATTIRVVSQRSKDTLVGFGRKPERVLYLPVRSDQVDTDTKCLPVQLPFAPGTVVVLTLARLVPQKNLPLLLKAVSTIYKSGAPIGLVVVGSGREELRLKQLVAKLNLTSVVHFVPWTDTPAAYYKAADIYALTSDWEGWARVLVEAMAYGLPVVSTDVGCAGEVVLDGEHGFIVPVRALRRFTERLGELVNDPDLRARFAQTAITDSQALVQSMDEYAEHWYAVLKKTSERFHQSR